MVRVFLDSSFLLEAKHSGFDVFAIVEKLLDDRLQNPEYVLLTAVKSELLNKGYSQRMLEELVRAHKIKEEKFEGLADELLFHKTVESKGILCSNDIPLVKRVRDEGCKCISFMGKGKLVLR